MIRAFILLNSRRRKSELKMFTRCITSTRLVFHKTKFKFASILKLPVFLSNRGRTNLKWPCSDTLSGRRITITDDLHGLPHGSLPKVSPGDVYVCAQPTQYHITEPQLHGTVARVWPEDDGRCVVALFGQCSLSGGVGKKLKSIDWKYWPIVLLSIFLRRLTIAICSSCLCW